MRVLIAEDDAVHRRLLTAILTKWGHEVTVAANGDEAWAKLQQEDAPGLAILDWQMPGCSGPEVCRRLRILERSRYVYVMLITAMGQRQDLLEGLDAGVDDYLVKPFDLPLLQARIAVAQRILEMQNKLLAAHEELSFQANHDHLTGLANRAAILESLNQEIHRGRRQNTLVGVLIADLDHFKRINDTHGHLAGDRALEEAARRISSSLRCYDSVGRFGGEEFLIVLPGCDADAAGQLADRIRQQICREPLSFSGELVGFSVSVGAASTSINGLADARDLIYAADLALYQAKRTGRNQVHVYTGMSNSLATFSPVIPSTPDDDCSLPTGSDRGATLPSPEDGKHCPAGGRSGPQLQQSA